MLLIPNRYVTFDNGTLTFHYYTRDYLGNNRTVVNGTTGEIEQSVAYYPFGGVIADLGFGHGEQQYKFGGMELDMANGLNEYDFGARRYYQGVPMFTQPDPMAEKYLWPSPYVYCGNNPVNITDEDGQEWKIEYDRDENDKLIIRMFISGVVFNHSNSKIDMEKLASNIKSQIEEVFTMDRDNFSVTMTADIRVAKSEKQIQDSDHLFAVVPKDYFNEPGRIADGGRNQLLIRLSPNVARNIASGIDIKSAAHELGHTGGLYDNDGSGPLEVSSPQTNLMTQYKYMDKGIDKYAARNLENKQIGQILRNYNKGLLNKNVHTIKDNYFIFLKSRRFIFRF